MADLVAMFPLPLQSKFVQNILISFFVVVIIISVLIVCKHEYLEWDMVMSPQNCSP